MKIDVRDIARLREMSGAGVMEAKKALEEALGDFEQAVTILRKQGAIKAEKKSTRQTGAGLIISYIHMDKIGVLLELNCETDFVARNDQFRILAQDIAMQIAAMNPLFISEEDITPEIMAKEREIYTHQLEQENKTKTAIGSIINGRLAKYKEEVVLLLQTFIKDEKITIKQRLDEAVRILGENIKIRRFARFELAGNASSCNLESSLNSN